jgi:hypothetical protein
VRQLRAARTDKVFREVASGAKTDRAQLRHPSEGNPSKGQYSLLVAHRQ